MGAWASDFRRFSRFQFFLKRRTEWSHKYITFHYRNLNVHDKYDVTCTLVPRGARLAAYQVLVLALTHTPLATKNERGHAVSQPVCFHRVHRRPQRIAFSFDGYSDDTCTVAFCGFHTRPTPLQPRRSALQRLGQVRTWETATSNHHHPSSRHLCYKKGVSQIHKRRMC